MKKLLLPIVLIISLYPFWLSGEVLGYEMESGSYRIQESSVNVGGLTEQTSTNYKMRESIGEVATGISTSSSYKLFAGFQQMQEIYLSVALSTTSLQMSPDIPGITGGSSTATLTATTTTDSPSGYSIYISASTSPAMKCQSGGCNVATDNFADYTPSTPGTPDFNWEVAPNAAEFGFTPEGSHIVQKFKDDSSSCNTGSNDTTDACWYNFSTSNEIIAQSYSANHPSGTPTTIKFQAESGPQNNQTSGNYGAVITITVVSN
ncbi:MAG: hypothetical protein DRH33_01775 [Candidatus Nealsonbacteria bacterium]|nr:MAG: hypothetical protein DRH33_01775 [Candidatus Nealsonbacteria bacterium]